MRAGRELDALVATKIMGWRSTNALGFGTVIMYPPHLHATSNVLGHTVPAYSTEIAAAFEVFCKFTSRYLWYDDATDVWHCHLDATRRVMEDCRHHGSEDEAPLTICLTALNAVGVTQEVTT